MRKLYIKLYNQRAEVETDICGRHDENVTGKAPKISLIIEFFFYLSWNMITASHSVWIAIKFFKREHNTSMLILL